MSSVTLVEPLETAPYIVLDRAGHALFFRLRACASALLEEALRALCFGLIFRAFAFALSRSRAFRFFALLDFSRSSIFRAPRFRARIFVLLYFRARNFVLVRLFTARTGQPGRDSQDRTPRLGQAEQDRHKDRQNRTCRTGQAEQDR
jgi:hypothetical protein